MAKPIILENEWATDMVALGVNMEIAEPIFLDIHFHYATPARHYHGLSHLNALFELLQAYAPQRAGSASRLAIWWHDVIYDPLSPKNESESANLAQIQLAQLGVDTALITRVCALIEATKNHFAAPSFGADDIFLDADIAILGAPEAIYTRYTQQIRDEYQQVPDILFAAGRKRFLETATEYPRILKTEVFETAFGSQARLNLERELKLYQNSE